MPNPSKRKTFIATWAAGAAGLVVIATAALAGCGQVGAGQGTPGAADSGPHAGQSPAGQSPEGQSPGGQAAAPMAVRSVCADPAAVMSVRVVRLPSRSQLGQTKPVPKKLPSIGLRVGDGRRARRGQVGREVAELLAETGPADWQLSSSPFTVARRPPPD